MYGNSKKRTREGEHAGLTAGLPAWPAASVEAPGSGGGGGINERKSMWACTKYSPMAKAP